MPDTATPETTGTAAPGTSAASARAGEGNTPADGTEATFGSSLEKVRRIVQLLERGDVDLETGARLYREACDALKFCRERLDAVRNEIELLNGTVLSDGEFLARAPQPETRDGADNRS